MLLVVKNKTEIEIAMMCMCCMCMRKFCYTKKSMLSLC